MRIVASIPILFCGYLAAEALPQGAVRNRHSDNGSATISVGENVPVTHGSGPYLEPVITANPQGAGLVAGALAQGDSGGLSLELYWSADAGVQWHRGQTDLRDTNLIGYGDLAIAFGSDGQVYQAANDGSATPVRSSSDLGRTWSLPVKVPTGDYGGWDREYLAADNWSRPYAHRLYYVGLNGTEERAAFSDDSGRSFRLGGAACRRTPSRNTIMSPTPIVLPDGTLLVGCMWWGTDGPRDSSAQATLIGIARSTDGGVTFSPSHIIAIAHQPPVEDRARSLLAGVTTDAMSNGDVYFAVDESVGPYRSTIYLTWRDWSAGRWNLLLSHSEDGGSTWSQPIPISSDSVHGTGQQMMAVNNRGVLGVAWYDHRLSERGQGYDVYFAASLDGGRSFLQEVRVTSVTSYPLRSADVVPHVLVASHTEGGVAWQFLPAVAVRPTGGDYSAMAADTSGAFHPIWLDARDGAWQVYSASVRIERLRSLPQQPGLATNAATCRAAVDNRLSIKFGASQVDSARAEIAVPVQLMNVSRDTVFGPIILTVHRLRSETRSYFVKNGLKQDEWFRGRFDSIWPAPSFVENRHGSISTDSTQVLVYTSALNPGDVTPSLSLGIKYGSTEGLLAPELTFETSIVAELHAAQGRTASGLQRNSLCSGKTAPTTATGRSQR
jgi:hypothetical protein